MSLLWKVNLWLRIAFTWRGNAFFPIAIHYYLNIGKILEIKFKCKVKNNRRRRSLWCVLNWALKYVCVTTCWTGIFGETIFVMKFLCHFKGLCLFALEGGGVFGLVSAGLCEDYLSQDWHRQNSGRGRRTGFVRKWRHWPEAVCLGWINGPAVVP